MCKKNEKITVVMYHYVRHLKKSRYPEIKGLDIDEFRYQLDYFSKHYDVISIDTLNKIIKDNKITQEKNDSEIDSKKPKILLTFDDAYIDHYTYVLPELLKRGMTGAFYVPIKMNEEKVMLDVNKIHIILASVEDKSVLVKEIFNQLDHYRKDFNIEKTNEAYYKQYAIKSRFDSADVIFIKRMLQVGIREDIRHLITDNIFNKYIDVSQDVLHEGLYMSTAQIQTMKQCGMHIGVHCYDHKWLSKLSKLEQEQEIDQSLKWMKKNDLLSDVLTMCYPYGDYNEDTLSIMESKGFDMAFTCQVDCYDIDHHGCHEIPRMDTNDFPKNAYSS